MGIIFIMPLPQMLQTMTTRMATRATGQLVAQLLTCLLYTSRDQLCEADVALNLASTFPYILANFICCF